MTKRGVIDCPICKRRMHVTVHAKYDRWTPEQLLLVERLRAFGFSKKLCARVLQADCTPGAIFEIERRHGWSRARHRAAAPA